MSLEALRRNGHNLHLGEFECEGQYDTPKLHSVHPAEKLDWISFNCASTNRKRDACGVHFFVDDYIFERTEEQNVLTFQPKVDAFIAKYTEIPEGADKAELTPEGLIAYQTFKRISAGYRQ